jgi:DNA modification methylase
MSETFLDGRVTLHVGDVRQVLSKMPDTSVNCVVTSPPYFGLRDYGVAGQIGLEATPSEFVAAMVDVFREIRRVLRDDGTLWLNLGDSYNNSDKWGGGGANTGKHRRTPDGDVASWKAVRRKWGGMEGLKPKDLIGIPWRVAFALQEDGWYLRKDIIWHKPNPMPESVTDRPTSAHEHLFFLTKSQRYWYDADAIREGMAPSSIARLSQSNLQNQIGSTRAHAGGKTNGNMKAVGRVRGVPPRHAQYESSDQSGLDEVTRGGGRNARDVWTIATQPFSEAHFATFPPELPRRCILAGCPKGGVVLDPFGGAGTTALVALRHGRRAELIELNPEYAAMARRRIETEWRVPQEHVADDFGPLFAGDLA